jgi:3-methyl-2-oxobutanoate hydroxymethyltransferase
MAEHKHIRIRDLSEKKRRGEKITMLTAYDAALARLLDRAGLDAILVGDSLGMVVLGHETTLPVTLDEMVHHTKAVARGVRRALIVADMPFLSYQAGIDDAVRNAGRLLQEGGAAAVKLEGGRAIVDVVDRLVSIGIPVMGHVGLTPQSVHQMSGFRRQARTAESASALIEEARMLEHAGAFAVVLESIPDEVAREVTSRLTIPTIGIGAGPHCDGQVLVSYDAFGLTGDYTPPFAKKYADLGRIISDATRGYIDDVRASRFPESRADSPRAEASAAAHE